MLESISLAKTETASGTRRRTLLCAGDIYGFLPWIVIILSLTLIIAGCLAEKEGATTPASTEETRHKEYVTVLQIKKHPLLFKDKVVVLKGICEGWRGNCGPPPVTRSDWVLKDRTGCIYITGGAAPRMIWGMPVMVEGVVDMKGGVPFIRLRRLIRRGSPVPLNLKER